MIRCHFIHLSNLLIDTNDQNINLKRKKSHSLFGLWHLLKKCLFHRHIKARLEIELCILNVLQSIVSK